MRRRTGQSPQISNTEFLGRLIFGLLLLTSLSTACTHSNEPSTLAQNDQSANTVRVALSAAPSTLDPRFATDATGTRLTGLLFSSLVRLNSKLEVIGDAATGWTYANRTYVFKLREGLRFVISPQESRPLTKADLEFSLAEFTSSHSPFASSYHGIDHFEAWYDEHRREVKIHVREFSAPLLKDLARLKFLPEKETRELSGAEFAHHPIGSGPYTLISADSTTIVLKRNPLHPYLQPKNENLVFKIVHDDNTRFLKMLKGEIDIAQGELPPQKMLLLATHPEFEVLKQPGLSVTYLLLNLNNPILKNLKARQALSKAIDRDSIIRYKLSDFAIPAVGLLTPAHPFFNSELKAEVFDPKLARALLDETAPRTRGLVLKTSNTPIAIENGRVLAHELNDIGLDVKLQSYEWGTFYSDVQHGNFQMAVMKWVATLDADIYRLQFDSHERPPLGRNRGHYSNLALDPLLEAGPHIENLAARMAHYREIQKIVSEDMPIIPLWYEMEVAIVRRNIQGYTLSRNGDYLNLINVSKLGPAVKK